MMGLEPCHQSMQIQVYHDRESIQDVKVAKIIDRTSVVDYTLHCIKAVASRVLASCLLSVCIFGSVLAFKTVGILENTEEKFRIEFGKNFFYGMVGIVLGNLNYIGNTTSKPQHESQKDRNHFVRNCVMIAEIAGAFMLSHVFEPIQSATSNLLIPILFGVTYLSEGLLSLFMISDYALPVIQQPSEEETDPIQSMKIELIKQSGNKMEKTVVI